MKRFSNYISGLSKTKKLSILVCFLIVGAFLLVSIPSLARLNNRNTVLLGEYWNGSVAASYRSGTGTAIDPYIIANGAEFAYFSEMSKVNDYTDTYFELNGDILLNEGVFSYDGASVIYKLDNINYYVNAKTGEYFNNADFTGEVLGTVNLFGSIENFSGNFDGDSYSVYGLLITGDTEVGLFNNLSGYVSDLYVTNSFIYGGSVTGGIASSFSGTIDNVIYDGNVVSDKYDSTKVVEEAIVDSSITIVENVNNYIITPTNGDIDGRIYKSSLSFDYNIIEGAVVSVNGTVVNDGKVNLEYENIMTEVVVSVIGGNVDEVVNLTNIKYSVYYDKGIVGGLVGLNDGGVILNSVNKSSVTGLSYSSGLIGATVSDLNITNSYNTGIISGYYASGLVSSITGVVGEVNILNSYNSGNTYGESSSGLVSQITNNTGDINIIRVFDAGMSNHSFNNIVNSNTSIISAYYVNGSGIHLDDSYNSMVQVSYNNLIDSSYMKANLLFEEYIDLDNVATNENVWIFDGNSLPILYIDDINNPIASIEAGSFKWNNYTELVDTVTTSSSFNFRVEQIDMTRPINEIYYYVGDGNVLTTTEVDSLLLPYTGEVLLDTEGSYIIYVKVVDYSGNVYYMNSDILVIDYSNMDSSISVGADNWNTLTNSNEYKYYDTIPTVRIRANDQLSVDDSVVYYITDKMMTKEELELLDVSNWLIYSNQITLDTLGTYVIYARVVDSDGKMRYINTDYIVYDGYSEEVSLGVSNNYESYSNNISSSSKVRVNFTYNSSSKLVEDTTHAFISTMLFPKDTVITMIDNTTSKVYKYEISTDVDIYDYGTSCDGFGPTCVPKAVYPLTLFREVGTAVMVKPYEEISYYADGSYTEDFTFILDFSDALINNDYLDVEFTMNLLDKDNNSIRPTLNTGIESINLYSGDNTVDLNITSNYTGGEILLNSESTTHVLLNTNYLYNTDIVDTSFENMYTGIGIRLLDNLGNVVDKSKYSDIKFSIDGKYFIAGNDNIFRYNLGKKYSLVSNNLFIETSGLDNKLEDGIYTIEVFNYLGNDGYFFDVESTSKVSINCRVSNNYTNSDYSFDVLDMNNNKIINKSKIENDKVTFNYNILQKIGLGSSSVRVSLYKKDEGNSFDQNYSIVDLDTYVSSHLNKIGDNTYLVSDKLFVYDGTSDTYNQFGMDFIPSTMNSGGYKLVFELYDTDRKVGTINRYFIVR